MFTPGTLIDGRYEVLGLLASGGMGQVYRARRVRLGDEVAIKVMIPSTDGAEELAERFLRESQSCAQLRHPNIVGILDFSVDAQQRPYLVMELLSGPSLREEIELHGPMEPASALAILDAVAGALQLAHDRGITHRDLKPANIVAHRYESGDRVYKIIDFGLAAIAAGSDETRLTSPFAFLGTLAYAAPEQMRGETVDLRTDVYALGVIAHELLTGIRPPSADFPPPAGPARDAQSTSTATIPILTPAVAAAIQRAMARERDERWPRVIDFVDALRGAIGDGREAVESAASGAGLLDRYELGAHLGRGRLGSHVYRGTHRALGIPVAIRVLKREYHPHWEAARARFLLEARTLQVAHPSLLQVRDFGEDGQSVFVVTEFIAGVSLSEALAAAPMAWSRVQPLLLQMLDAAEALHARGGFLVGVNPDMIRLTTDAAGERIVMSTAGIRSVQDVLATMREQELRGQEASEHELPYVAPDVLMGKPPDARADLFTIGVLAFEMLTTTLPFRASSLPEVLGAMLQTPASTWRERIAGVPASAVAALERALQPAPDARFPSAAAMRDALR